MNIAILTYDHPHRKTQELIMRMKANGYGEATVIVTPWVDRKGHIPLYPHRFLKAFDIPIQEFALNFSYDVMMPDDLAKCLSQFDYALIGGAGILTEEVVNSTKIINSHPGYLPRTRGLDALKWAIYNGEEIGVTSYIIGAEADTGILIERCWTFPKPLDSFHSFAIKHFDLEIDMLVRAIHKRKDWAGRNIQDDILEPEGIVHKRMKHWQEIIMVKRFDELKISRQSR